MRTRIGLRNEKEVLERLNIKHSWQSQAAKPSERLKIMKKRKYKNKKRLKLNNNLQTMRNVLEGDRIYHLMAQAMLSADTSVGGTVAMNYALGKLIAIYKQAMKGLGIDVEAYISDMTDWWSRKISEGADAEDKAQFDEFMTSVETQTLIDTISK